MPLVDSRLGVGTIKFATFDFSFQAANVKLVPSVDETDGTKTLAEPAPPPLATITWALEGTCIQDFEAATGFVNWAFDNALTEVSFEFIPVTPAGVKWDGTVQVRPVEMGGDAGVQITTDFSMPCVGVPVRTDAVLGTREAAKASSK